MNNLNLKYFNLTDNEVNVYMNLLSNDSQSVVELSKNLKISRTGLYKILDKLKKVNLVYKKNKAYCLQNPKMLYEKLKEEEEIIKNQKQIIEHIVEISRRPKIKFFYGLKGHQELNNELRKDPVKNGYIVVNSDFMPKDLESRRSKELYVNDIVINFTNKKKKKSKRNELQLPYINQTKFSAISIFGDKVAFYSTSDKTDYGLLVVDNHLSNLLKDIINAIKK